MNRFYLDASALVKRYLVETGSPLVSALFQGASPERMMALLIGAGEVLSVLTRRRNAGQISHASYARSVVQLETEVIRSRAFTLLTAADPMVHASFPLIERHAINSNDALVLRSALDEALTLRAAGDDLVLLAADARLLRAASAEGLAVFSPESDTQAQLNALL